ncbi:MAG: sulfatase [Actinomycetota bacterium]
MRGWPNSRFLHAGPLALLAVALLGLAPAASSAASSAGASSGAAQPAVSEPSPQPQAPPAPSDPNVVFIVSDDQRWDTLDAMPNVLSQIATPGVTFENAFVSNPLCCPSRVSILTGQTSATSGVWRNAPPGGGFESFDDSTTIATELQGAGYRTGLFGKYLQGYAPDGTYVPPGWSAWAARDRAAYFDYTLNVDGVPTAFGSASQDYSTDVLAGMADGFIRSTPSYQPLFLFFSPSAPHLPATPAPRHDGAFDGIAKYRPSSFDRIGTGSPPWAEALPPLAWRDRAKLDELRRDMLETLLALDEAVGTIVTALHDTGRLSETLLVFTSDNGYLWGEHRREGKSVAYEESIRVPLVVRYDPAATAGALDDRFAMNIDLAPTAAAAAGVALPAPDGKSLLPLLQNSEGPGVRSRVVVEQIPHSSFDVPPYCAIRTRRHSYIRYRNGATELFDLRRDPYQLRNLTADQAHRPLVRSLVRGTRSACEHSLRG